MDVGIIAAQGGLVVSFDPFEQRQQMTEKKCERCRMIRFYLIWTILMSILMYFYLKSI
jgi:hypothetical protein